MAYRSDGTRPVWSVSDLRNIHIADVPDISKHRHDTGSYPSEWFTASICFVWWFAHGVDRDHGGPCAERAYEAPGINGLTETGRQSPKSAALGKGSGGSLKGKDGRFAHPKVDHAIAIRECEDESSSFEALDRDDIARGRQCCHLGAISHQGNEQDI